MSDLISRQAAIDALNYCDFTKSNNDGNALYEDSVIYELQQLPSAQPEWIPCREKAAEPNCLACDEFGQVFIASSIVTINGVCYDGTGFNFDVKEFLKGEKMQTLSGYIYVPPRKITAWMPLPEPYKEGEAHETD